jgi:hypothetical protein
MWKYPDRWDREGLNGCNGPCAEVFEFFVPINSDGFLFLLMIFFFFFFFFEPIYIPEYKPETKPGRSYEPLHLETKVN